MKLKLILLSAIIVLSSVTLTGCGNEGGTPAQNGANNSTNNNTTSNTTSNTNSTALNGFSNADNEQPPMDFIEEDNNTGYPDIWDVLPYIDETPASRFEYEETDEYGGGIKITGYLAESTRIRIPDTIDGKPVVDVEIGNSKITELILPDTVQKLKAGKSKYANSDNTCLPNLEYINIPAQLSEYDFEDIGKSTVYIQDGVTSIPGDMLYNTKLISVTIPDSVTEIERDAFWWCSELTSITIPDSVTKIGEAAFFGCESLTSITIPDGVTEIGKRTFEGCTSLTSVTIPDSVTEIGEYAFSGCTGLTSVTIPDSVTSIGKRAFEGCTGLTSVTIGNSVTSIGASAFISCSSLTSVTIPDGVSRIGSWAFSDCSNLSSVTIPDSVTEIGTGIFSGCKNLTNATYKGKTYSYDYIGELYDTINFG